MSKSLGISISTDLEKLESLSESELLIKPFSLSSPNKIRAIGSYLSKFSSSLNAFLEITWFEN